MSSHLYTFGRLILPTWPKSAKSKDNWLFSRLSFYFIGGYRISITKLTECKLKNVKPYFETNEKIENENEAAFAYFWKIRQKNIN